MATPQVVQIYAPFLHPLERIWAIHVGQAVWSGEKYEITSPCGKYGYFWNDYQDLCLEQICAESRRSLPTSLRGSAQSTYRKLLELILLCWAVNHDGYDRTLPLIPLTSGQVFTGIGLAKDLIVCPPSLEMIPEEQLAIYKKRGDEGSFHDRDVLRTLGNIERMIAITILSHQRAQGTEASQLASIANNLCPPIRL